MRRKRSVHTAAVHYCACGCGFPASPTLGRLWQRQYATEACRQRVAARPYAYSTYKRFSHHDLPSAVIERLVADAFTYVRRTRLFTIPEVTDVYALSVSTLHPTPSADRADWRPSTTVLQQAMQRPRLRTHPSEPQTYAHTRRRPRRPPRT